jgi:hypothetical protein
LGNGQPTLPRSEEPIDLVSVVCAAAQLDVVHRRLAAGRKRKEVMELQKAPRLAAMAVARDER